MSAHPGALMCNAHVLGGLKRSVFAGSANDTHPFKTSATPSLNILFLLKKLLDFE